MKRTLDWWFRGRGWDWLTAVLLIAMLLVLFVPHAPTGCKERDIRLGGVFLEVVGFLSIAVGLWDTGLHIGRSTFRDRLRDLWARRPFFRPRRDGVVEGKGLSVAVSLASGRARGTAGPGGTVEQRLAILEREIEAHDDEISRMERTQRETKASLERVIADEATKRSQADADLLKTINTTVAHGINLEWRGAVFAGVGLFLASVAPEIALMLGHSSSCAPAASMAVLGTPESLAQGIR